MSQQIAVLGLGAMGLAMARRLASGLEVTGFDPDPGRRGLAEDATSSGTFMFGNDLDGTLVLSGSTRTRVDKFTTSATYTVTNPTTDRSLDVTGDTLAQVAQVLGTLIADLKAIGLIG